MDSMDSYSPHTYTQRALFMLPRDLLKRLLSGQTHHGRKAVRKSLLAVRLRGKRAYSRPASNILAKEIMTRLKDPRFARDVRRALTLNAPQVEVN